MSTVETAVTGLDDASFRRPDPGFTMAEVVIAIGVFAFAIFALLGLLLPTLDSVEEVVDSNRATAAISKINTWLQLREFDWVYGEVTDADGEIRLYAYDLNTDPEGPARYTTDRITGDIERMRSEAAAMVGSALLVVLRPAEYGPTGGPLPPLEEYPEGYLKLSIDVYLLPRLDQATFATDRPLAEFKRLLTYYSAITR